METSDWQTWAALAVVVITIGLFLFRARKKKSGGCNNCGPGKDCR